MSSQSTEELRPILTQILSRAQVQEYRLLPFEETESILQCYTDVSPSNTTLQEWTVLLGKQLVLTLLTEKTFETLLSQHFYHSVQAQAQLIASEDILEQILKTAHGLQSSDVHFEVFADTARVRFRLDGKLKTFFTPPKTEYPSLINKIKIKAQLDISEKRLPQDGRISMQTQSGEEVDLRVSSLPTLHGEKLVLRILSRDAGLHTLEELGFYSADLKIYREQLKNTQGLILLSGPTGAGKTTTLYATLKELNTSTTNILTIEDPIEYTLEGINQVQLKDAIGLSFPNALRSFLRQDPDIIMVGEIRDEATAQMAVRAALTGHLVLATLHTNSAWGSLTRLIDMGIPPFLLMETLRLSVAQRLVRRLCPECAESTEVWPKNITPIKEGVTHRVPMGCNQCFHTGYRGRVALYELLPMQTSLKEAFLEKALSEQQYQSYHSYTTLKQQAFRLVTEGITSVDEVYSLLAF